MAGSFLDQAVKTARSLRVGMVVVIASLLVGLTVWAQIEIAADGERVRQSRSEALHALSRVSQELFLADEARIDGVVERLRSELRAEGSWTVQPAADDTRADGATSADPRRRVRTILRRALANVPELIAFELVVAGQDGLSILRVEGAQGQGAAPGADARDREGQAKALWYSEAVRRAVASGGSGTERGEITFERSGDRERPLVKTAIGLHDADELVQGVLLASVDLTSSLARLEGLAGGDTRSMLIAPDGRSLHSSLGAGKGLPWLADSPTSPAEAARISDLEKPAPLVSRVSPRSAALATRLFGAEADLDVFEVENRLILGTPLAHRNGRVADLLLLLDTPAPATGLSAWLESSWPLPLVSLAWVSALACALLWYSPEPVSAPAAGRTGSSERLRSDWTGRLPQAPDGALTIGGEPRDAAGASAIVVTNEHFSLRDWLADIRGCLERDAATRGLRLVLRCERSLPTELAQDPQWLGGLLLAMGREALDATREDRVSLEVLEDTGHALRFEVDAGGVELRPVAGMNEVARALGGQLESHGTGRLALVLDHALP